MSSQRQRHEAEEVDGRSRRHTTLALLRLPLPEHHYGGLLQGFFHVGKGKTLYFHCSSDKRSGHIPYRDSKLTHILQLSLGGNARTAIICTMSPAQRHVEQSRNALFFATCAKEATNNAKVNMMEKEMEELKKQRDNAQSKLEELQKKMGDNQPLFCFWKRNHLSEKKRLVHDKGKKKLSSHKEAPLLACKTKEMGYAASVERFLKLMAMVWAGNQVTKILRAGALLALRSPDKATTRRSSHESLRGSKQGSSGRDGG
uniref:Kinesin motor domain-containing protein n=1 Tax=Oryza glumipatula TaxID=40148 RepID=A0A0E0BGJ1_9ORYZ